MEKEENEKIEEKKKKDESKEQITFASAIRINSKFINQVQFVI